MQRFQVPREALSELQQIKSSLWIKDLVLDWTQIAFYFFLFNWIGRPLWAVPVFALLIGARQHALGLLAHDATHQVGFKNRKLNNILGEFFSGWPLFLALEQGYRPWHFDHHRDLGSPKDPELNYRDAAPYIPPISTQKIFRMFFTDMLGLGIGGLFLFMKEIFPYKKPYFILGPLCWWVAGTAICVHLNATWIALLWSWSLVTGFWAVFRIRTWTEHVGVKPQGKATSHRFSADPISRYLFFPHNTHCHWEHHIWSQVPYYNLPKLRKLYTLTPVVPLSELILDYEKHDEPPVSKAA